MNGKTTSIARWFLMVVVLVAMGLATVQGVAARKITVKAAASVKDRVQAQRDVCEVIGGGKLSVTSTSIITFTTCEGGTEGGTSCTHTKEETTCETPNRIQPTPNIRADTVVVANTEAAIAPAIETPVTTEPSVEASTGTTMVVIAEEQP